MPFRIALPTKPMGSFSIGESKTHSAKLSCRKNKCYKPCTMPRKDKMRLSDIGRAKMQQAFRSVVDLKAHRAKIKAEKADAEFFAKMMANDIQREGRLLQMGFALYNWSDEFQCYMRKARIVNA